MNMITFARTSAVALSWNQRSCSAIRLERGRDRFQVAAAWQTEFSQHKDLTLAELLAQACKALAVDENTYVLATGSSQGWGMADIRMPALKSEELRSALGFELRKQTPLPPEKLHWGYRVLPKENKPDGKVTVRLYYVSNEQWDQWITALGGLSHLDGILPAPAALDPLMAGKSLTLVEENGAAHQYAPAAGGARAICPAATPDWQQAIPWQDFDTTRLGEINDRQRWDYLPALVLAAYGLTRDCVTDETTRAPVPENLKAHRHAASKAVAALLAFLVVIALLTGLIRNLQQKAAHLRQLEAEIKAVETRLGAFAKMNNPNEADFCTVLRQEMTDNLKTGPDFPETLLELTRLIEPPAWIAQRLEWSDNLVTLQLQSSQRDLDLAGKLEESPLLGDVRELGTTFNQGLYSIRISLNARHDAEDELEASARRQAERRQRETAAPANGEPDPANTLPAADENSDTAIAPENP